MAEQEGETEKVKNLADKLVELEERADQLDKQRTKGLSAIRYIHNIIENPLRGKLHPSPPLAFGREGEQHLEYGACILLQY